MWLTEWTMVETWKQRNALGGYSSGPGEKRWCAGSSEGREMPANLGHSGDRGDRTVRVSDDCKGSALSNWYIYLHQDNSGPTTSQGWLLTMIQVSEWDGLFGILPWLPTPILLVALSLILILRTYEYLKLSYSFYLTDFSSGSPNGMQGIRIMSILFFASSSVLNSVPQS